MIWLGLTTLHVTGGTAINGLNDRGNHERDRSRLRRDPRVYAVIHHPVGLPRNSYGVVWNIFDVKRPYVILHDSRLNKRESHEGIRIPNVQRPTTRLLRKHDRYIQMVEGEDGTPVTC